MAVQLTLADLERAADSRSMRFAREGLSSCLPPGVPLVGQIAGAKWLGKNKVIATLTLFDGGQGQVEVFQWSMAGYNAWGQQWRELPGGAINWNGKEWERVNLAALLGAAQREGE